MDHVSGSEGGGSKAAPPRVEGQCRESWDAAAARAGPGRSAAPGPAPGAPPAPPQGEPTRSARPSWASRPDPPAPPRLAQPSPAAGPRGQRPRRAPHPPRRTRERWDGPAAPPPPTHAAPEPLAGGRAPPAHPCPRGRSRPGPAPACCGQAVERGWGRLRTGGAVLRPRCYSRGHWRAKWRRHRSARRRSGPRRAGAAPPAACPACRATPPPAPREAPALAAQSSPTAGGAAAASQEPDGSTAARQALERAAPAAAGACGRAGPARGRGRAGSLCAGRAEGLGLPAGQAGLHGGCSSRTLTRSALGPAGECSLLGMGGSHIAGSMRRCPSRETARHPPGAHPPPALAQGLDKALSWGQPRRLGGLCADGPCRVQLPLLAAPRSPFPSAGKSTAEHCALTQCPASLRRAARLCRPTAAQHITNYMLCCCYPRAQTHGDTPQDGCPIAALAVALYLTRFGASCRQVATDFPLA